MNVRPIAHLNVDKSVDFVGFGSFYILMNFGWGTCCETPIQEVKICYGT